MKATRARNVNGNKMDLSPGQRIEMLGTLKARFEKNMARHKGLEWAQVQAKLEPDVEKLSSLHEMERTGGEPDVVGHDKNTNEYIFYDSSEESPKGRRSICYDREALESRKEHKPKNNAENMAVAMGIELLTEEQYRGLQKLGNFDTKTSSWVKTPSAVRKLGGALFCDRRFDTVFVYNNCVYISRFRASKGKVPYNGFHSTAKSRRLPTFHDPTGHEEERMRDNKGWTELVREAALVLVLGATATIVSAQGTGGAGGATPQPLAVHQLKPNVYWVEGAGGNSAVIVGNNGVIVVDTKTTAAAGAELVADVAKITPKPITTVFLTHSDGDHVNGLASFPSGIAIIAQENCKTEMQAATSTPAGAALAGHMPTRTVTKNMEDMTIEGVHLRVFHFVPAHTSGDLMVYFPDDKIMFTGDIVAAQSPYPLVHLEKNGSTEGWATTMNGILETDAVTFIPGHGGVQAKADLQKRLADETARRNQIKALVAQGKSLDDVRQALGETPPPTRPGQTDPAFTDFTGVVYAELTKK